MLEVDQKKIKHGVFDFEKISDANDNGNDEEGAGRNKKKEKKKRKRRERIRVPIVHYKDERAQPPAIVLVKGGGLHPGLEENLEEFRKRHGGESVVLFN